MVTDDDIRPGRTPSKYDAGRASDLFERGWLPPGAAARRLGITTGELLTRAFSGQIRSRQIGPSARLFEVAP